MDRLHLQKHVPESIPFEQRQRAAAVKDGFVLAMRLAVVAADTNVRKLVSQKGGQIVDLPLQRLLKADEVGPMEGHLAGDRDPSGGPGVFREVRVVRHFFVRWDRGWQTR